MNPVQRDVPELHSSVRAIAHGRDANQSGLLEDSFASITSGEKGRLIGGFCRPSYTTSLVRSLPSRLLADWAVEGRTLRLDNAPDVSLPAAWTSLPLAIVHAMTTLVSAGIVQCIAIRSVGQS